MNKGKLYVKPCLPVLEQVLELRAISANVRMATFIAELNVEDQWSCLNDLNAMWKLVE